MNDSQKLDAILKAVTDQDADVDDIKKTLARIERCVDKIHALATSILTWAKRAAGATGKRR